jgi:hypothetical protein
MNFSHLTNFKHILFLTWSCDFDGWLSISQWLMVGDWASIIADNTSTSNSDEGEEGQELEKGHLH